VLVRHDLPATQITVQAIHAALEASRQFLPHDCEHPHLVVCGVASEERLLKAADHLFRNKVRHVLFREPDINHQPTALATEPLHCERRRLLDRFRCLRREDLLAAASEQGPITPCRENP
jgi:hypothetical protein